MIERLKKENPFVQWEVQPGGNAILAVAIAWRYPNEVHLAGVVIGLMTIYPVIMIDSFIQLKRSTMEER